MASLLLDDQEQVTLVKVKSYIGRKRGREGEKVRYKKSEIYIERDINKEREREIKRERERESKWRTRPEFYSYNSSIRCLV